MSDSQRHTLLWGAVIIFVGLDIWLLYSKVNLQQQVGRLQAKSIQKGGAVSMMAKDIRYTPSAGTANDPALKPLNLVAIFTDYGCSHCAQAEIQRLNRWNKRFPGTLQVYFTGTSKKYMKTFGARFSFEKIKSADRLFSVSLPIGNPLAALVDQKGNVQAIHTNDTSRPGSDQRRAAFYKRMYSLFRSVYGTQ